MAEHLLNLCEAVAKIGILACYLIVLGMPLVNWVSKLEGKPLDRNPRPRIMRFLFTIALVIIFTLLARHFYFDQKFWESMLD